MNDSFDRDAPERSSSSTGVKALRARLEQQNREAPAQPFKSAAAHPQQTNGKGARAGQSNMTEGAGGGLPAIAGTSQEAARWKKEAEQHKLAAHELAKAAKAAKQEASEARKLLEEEQASAQRSLDEVMHRNKELQQQIQHLSSSPSKVVSTSAEVGTLLSQLNESNYKHHALMQEIKNKEDEVAEIRRQAMQTISDERDLSAVQIKQLQDTLEQEREITKQQQRTIDEKLNHDESSVAVLLEALNNRDRSISDLERLLANARILASTQPEPVDAQQLRSTTDELRSAQNVIELQTTELDATRDQVNNLETDVARLLDQRSLLQSKLEDALDALKTLERRAFQQNSTQDNGQKELTIQELLSLQEELVHELDMMKRDMATLALQNKSLEDERAQLLAQLAGYDGEDSAVRNQAIASKTKKRAQRSAAPGSPRDGPAWNKEVNSSQHSALLEQGLISPWEVMEQEAASRQTLEAEIGTLKDALRLAQQGQAPIMETCEHIHAVSIGLMSPWEGMRQADLQLKELKMELTELRQHMVHSIDRVSDDHVHELENANDKMKAKLLQVTTMLQESKEDAADARRRLQDSERRLVDALPAPKADDVSKEELERLQTICEQQSKWILESSRNNRDRLLLVELHGHILNIQEESRDIETLKKLVESQKSDAGKEGDSLTVRPLPKLRASASSESLYASHDNATTTYSSWRMLSSSQDGSTHDQRDQEMRHSTDDGSSDIMTVQRQQRAQRSAGPGALRSGSPPVSRPYTDSGRESPGLRVSSSTQGTELLSAYPENFDMYASGASASSKYSMDAAALQVPEISDDILNYRPPSTAEMRRSKLAAATSKMSPSRSVLHESTNAIKPSEYMKSHSIKDAKSDVVTAGSKVSYSSTSMTPSEYMMSRGIQNNTTESVRHAHVQGSPLGVSGYEGGSQSPLPQIGGLTPDRLDKFAQYQQMLQRQEAEAEQEWEAGLSNVQLTPDGNIMPVGAALRSSKLMPVVEDEDEEASGEGKVLTPGPSFALMDPRDVYPPELGGTPHAERDPGQCDQDPDMEGI